MNRFVLDASVALKWAIPPANETLSAESLQLLKEYVNGRVDLLVPDIFWAEVGNVLWKGVRLRRWSRTTAERIASEMQARNFSTVPSRTLMTEALRIAFAYDRAVYDCLYVALAVRSKSQMITADERLANALAAYLPVKWLGAL
ncbi:MAG: type II toxin-antitoxin system VapC family toxin [Candidatus Sulfotelmatobacter sp.]